MKRLICSIALFVAISFINVACAQDFKWVKGGGSTDFFSTYLTNEAVRFMCTDPHGNVYALSTLGGRPGSPIRADTFSRPGGAYGVNQNFLLASYNCSGIMRWVKLIGSENDVIPIAITADSLGHIYVAGRFAHNYGPLHIGYDTTITGDIYLSTGLVQYDTSGEFNWIRFLGNNTLATMIRTSSTGCLAMGSTANVHFFSYMGSNVPLMPGDTSVCGVYDMLYDPTGSLLSAVRLDLDSQWFLHGAVIDPITNKLYAYGEINQSIYGGLLTDTFFTASFDASRNLQWMYFCGHHNDAGLGGIAMDDNKHLYFTGAAQWSGIGTIRTTFYYNGDSVSNMRRPGGQMSVVLKADTLGRPLWIKHFDGTSAINYLIAITKLPNGKVAMAGTYGGVVTDGIDSLVTPTGEAQNPFLVIVDSAGNLED